MSEHANKDILPKPVTFMVPKPPFDIPPEQFYSFVRIDLPQPSPKNTKKVCKEHKPLRWSAFSKSE